ncbi:MAG: secondary thiamine-phosphate synthase enzyme YjbQ [Candidatus Aenigmarchaeota archaeon]|nr:secondary thiamine-phosphate synthase enzyme YjbQ [Candidatus Aenigmarchaeota archaeon]
MIKTERISVKSEGHGDIIDITGKVQEIVEKSKAKNGSAVIFVNGSTASVSTIEYEPNLVNDMKRVLEKIAPYGKDYEHHKTWGDDNGSAHIKSTLLGPGITVPFEDRKLLLGTWQQIVVLDFDTRPRSREVIVQVIGD